MKQNIQEILPGKVSQSVFKIDTQQKIQTKNKEQKQFVKAKDLVKQQVNNLESLSTVKIRTTGARFTSVIPMWNKKDNSDTNKRQQYEAQIKQLKGELQNAFVKNHEQLLKLQEQNQTNEFMQQSITKAYKETRETVQANLNIDLKAQQTVTLQIDPDDIYTLPIEISQILQLFQTTFDYKTSLDEYLQQFKELSTVVKTIQKITLKTKHQKIVFRQNTIEGLQRAKQLNQADMYNKQLSQTLNQLVQLCCGSFYCPDKNFTTKYCDLKPEIQKLINVQLMANTKSNPLYQLIGCGEAVNYLTFDAESYKKYLTEIEEQFKKDKTWQPFQQFKKALEIKQKNPRTKGVASTYRRCGYECQLLLNAESVCLYFICQLALAQGGSPMLSGPEITIFRDKITNCLQNFDSFQQKMSGDQLWGAVREFVMRRTGGIKIQQIDFDDETQPQETEERKSGCDKFRFGDLVVSYSSGKVFGVGEMEMDGEYDQEQFDHVVGEVQEMQVDEPVPQDVGEFAELPPMEEAQHEPVEPEQPVEQIDEHIPMKRRQKKQEEMQQVEEQPPNDLQEPDMPPNDQEMVEMPNDKEMPPEMPPNDEMPPEELPNDLPPTDLPADLPPTDDLPPNDDMPPEIPEVKTEKDEEQSGISETKKKHKKRSHDENQSSVNEQSESQSEAQIEKKRKRKPKKEE